MFSHGALYAICMWFLISGEGCGAAPEVPPLPVRQIEGGCNIIN